MSLGFTQADLAALKKALASGATEVQLGDRRVKYQTLGELLKIIQLVQAELEGSSSDNPSMIQSGFSKGVK